MFLTYAGEKKETSGHKHPCEEMHLQYIKCINKQGIKTSRKDGFDTNLILHTVWWQIPLGCCQTRTCPTRTGRRVRCFQRGRSTGNMSMLYRHCSKVGETCPLLKVMTRVYIYVIASSLYYSSLLLF